MEVEAAWTRLLAVKELTFEARSSATANTGWVGSGKGLVSVESIDPRVMLFRESGTFTPSVGAQTTFTNIYSWTVDPDAQLIRLEHLRFGPTRPVYLFNLVPIKAGVLESSSPHVCSEDCYAARMEFDAQSVRLRWTISGPKKAEEIAYTYS